MRYVDLSKLVKPNGWNQRAQDAAEAVRNGDDPNNHDNVWRELKDELAKLLGDKCWYCESPINRSDNAVDHFRPKSRVKDASDEHNGYKWLAFDADNYRYACTFCNSRRIDGRGGTEGGKADCFPLVDESTRVYQEGPIAQEQPMLLDPCDLDDWRLLGCQQENGKPCATSEDEVASARAEKTIRLCHLHRESTCKQRHREAVSLMAKVDEGKRLFEQSKESQDKRIDFKKIAKEIKRFITQDAPYSGSMHFLLRSQRSENHPWIQKLLEV